MQRLRAVRDGFASDVTKAERDLNRAQAKLEAARVKLKVADEMIARVKSPAEKQDTGTIPFVGMGKYAKSKLTDAVLDVINSRAEPDGMSVNQIRDVLIAEGVEPKPNLLITIHVLADRLKDRGLIRIETTDEGKCILKVTKPRESAASAAA